VPTLTDEKFASLRAQGHAGAVPDMTLLWLQANGATSPSIPDAWAEMLSSKGFDPQRSDSWYEYLGSIGFTQGHINDREMAFWLAGGVLP